MSSQSQPEYPVYVLGVDAGGTKSEAVLADHEGHVFGRGFCDFRDPDSGRGPGGSGRTARTVRKAIQQAIAGLSPEARLVVAVAGPGRLPSEWLPDGHQWDVYHVPVREQDGPLALASEIVGPPPHPGANDAGVVVLAGTGAFVYARSPDGREVHLDALGPLLGDAGSAFEIGLRAVRAVARASWHQRRHTSLVEPIIEACRQYSGDGKRFSLVEYMLQCRDRSEIASLAQIVNSHAEAGDRVARDILLAAADSIVETLQDAVDRLCLQHADLPMVAAGSVAKRSRIYWARVCERAADIAPGLRPVQPTEPDVVGVMLAATRHIRGLASQFGATLRMESVRAWGGVT